MSMQNAWVLAMGRSQFDGFAITYDMTCSGDVIQRGDGLILVAEDSAFAVGRAYRVREAVGEVTVYLDAIARAVKPASLDDLGLPVGSSTAATRVEWDIFDGAVTRLTGESFDALPRLAGTSKDEQAYVRDLLRFAVVDDLLGPANGPHEEIVGMSVRDRYLVGKLASIFHGARSSALVASLPVVRADCGMRV